MYNCAKCGNLIQMVRLYVGQSKILQMSVHKFNPICQVHILHVVNPEDFIQIYLQLVEF